MNLTTPIATSSTTTAASSTHCCLYNKLQINALSVYAVSTNNIFQDSFDLEFYDKTLSRREVLQFSVPLLSQEMSPAHVKETLSGLLPTFPKVLIPLIVEYTGGFFPFIKTSLFPTLHSRITNTRHLLEGAESNKALNPPLHFPPEVPSYSLTALGQREANRITLFLDTPEHRNYHAFFQRLSFPAKVSGGSVFFPHEDKNEIPTPGITLPLQPSESEKEVSDDEEAPRVVDETLPDPIGRSLDILLVPAKNGQYLVPEMMHLHLSFDTLHIDENEPRMKAAARQQATKSAAMEQHITTCARVRTDRIAAHFFDPYLSSSTSDKENEESAPIALTATATSSASSSGSLPAEVHSKKRKWGEESAIANNFPTASATAASSSSSSSDETDPKKRK